MKKAYLIRLTLAAIIGILSLLAVLGLMYPIKIMNIQFSSLVQKIFFNFSFSALFLFICLIGITFVCGRVYCSTICPLGILQECFDILYKKIAKKKKKNPPQKNYKYKYILAFVVFSVLIGGSTIILKYIDPFTIAMNALSFSLIGIILVACVLVLVFFRNRFFCTNICPVGAILGLISKYSLLKINMDKSACVACGVCARSCPSGCIDIKDGKIDNEICVKCLKCIRVCPQNAISYSKVEANVVPDKKPKKKTKAKTKFSPTRREVLIGVGALSAFSALVAVGVTFSKNLAKKVKNIILPPGGVLARRMANKCSNCNLCVNNCPTRVLVKANKDFGAVHIDYSKGKGYCEYNCNNCGKVCPTGAIKRLSIDKKQQLKIAVASINPSCVGCGECKMECPTGAIEFDENGKYQVDSLKCVGCGMCSSVCPRNAITITPLSVQTTM